MRVKTKILLPAILLTLLVSVATLLSTIHLFSAFVHESTVDRVYSASKIAEHHMQDLESKTVAAALGIAENEEIADALMIGKREDLLVYATELLEQAEVDFCTITDAAGVVVIRTHAPERYKDSIASQDTIQSAMAGESMTAIEKGTVIRLSVCTAVPVFTHSGTVAGVVSVGYRLDTDTYVDTIKEVSGCEVSVFLGDERLSTTILQDDGTRAIGTKADARVSEPVLSGESYAGQANILGRTAVTSCTPVLGAGGQVLGMLLVSRYMAASDQTIGAFLQSNIFITLIILVVSIVVFSLIIQHILKPVHVLTQAAANLALGNTDIAIPVHSKDETGVLADAFRRIIVDTRQQTQMVIQIANGTLTEPVALRSEKDAMNRALQALDSTLKVQAAALQKEHERIQLMLDATPLASRLWSRDLKLIECNEAAVKLFGLSSKQEYIERFFELSPAFQPDGRTTRDKITIMVREAFEKGQCAYEWEYRMLDGTPVPVEITLVRVPYGGDYAVAAYSRDLREYRRIIGTLQDTSAKLKTALTDAKKANSAKSNFLAHMSHEIRTPLNAVIGLSELMLDGKGLNPEAETNLEKIYGAGNTILSIVNDILDIAKIESGKFEIHPVRYDTPSLINDTVMLNIVRIGEKPIAFKIDVDKNLPSVLLGDDLRVKQIFNNLLSNAFKYTHSGEVEWKISFLQGEEDNIMLLSSVRDTGIGIKPSDQQKLFSDYNQVDTKNNRRVDGTGLGLVITKSLVEMMGGSISVKSVFGKGTTFNLQFWQKRAGVQSTPIGSEVADNLMDLRYTLSRRSQNSELVRIDLSYAHILLVDDNQTNLDVAQGMLKPYGLKIDCALSGRQAVEMIRAGKPRYRAIFMDHMMPEMDGIETTRIIREEIGTQYAQKVPVIALTANAIVGNKEMFLRNGFQEFISKPIDVKKLDAVLRRWVRDKNREKKLAREHANPVSSQVEPPPAANAGDLFAALAIEGVDIPKGLSRFDNNEMVYLDVLRSYAAATRPLLAQSRAYLDAGNLEEYIVVVHGIKGSSYGICAPQIARAAEALEAYGREENWAAVRANQYIFEKRLETSLVSIENALRAIEAKIEKPIALSPAPTLLRELREACALFEMDRVDAVMAKLESFRYEKGEDLVAWLRGQVRDMAFEAISNGEWPTVF